MASSADHGIAQFHKTSAPSHSWHQLRVAQQEPAASRHRAPSKSPVQLGESTGCQHSGLRIMPLREPDHRFPAYLRIGVIQPGNQRLADFRRVCIEHGPQAKRRPITDVAGGFIRASLMSPSDRIANGSSNPREPADRRVSPGGLLHWDAPPSLCRTNRHPARGSSMPQCISRGDHNSFIAVICHQPKQQLHRFLVKAAVLSSHPSFAKISAPDTGTIQRIGADRVFAAKIKFGLPPR